MTGKVLLRLHLERGATATITRIYTTNTGAPAFHHKAAVFKARQTAAVASKPGSQ